jgi:hypothetical protein
MLVKLFQTDGADGLDAGSQQADTQAPTNQNFAVTPYGAPSAGASADGLGSATTGVSLATTLSTGASIAAAQGSPSNSQAATQGATSASVTGPVSSAGTGLVINVNYDTSITSLQTSDPTTYSEYTAAIATVVNYYQSLIKTPLTMTINFGYGEVNGQAISPSAAAMSITNYQLNFTYAQVYNAVKSLYAASTPVQAAALASLSATDPTGGGNFTLSQAQAAILGLYTGSVTAYVGISTWANTGQSWNWTQSGMTNTQYDVIGALEHEVSENLGRVDFGGKGAFGAGASDYTLLDLFRYDVAGNVQGAAPGTATAGRDLSSSTTNYTYFSYNGATVTQQYAEPTFVAAGDDIADWGTPVTGDSFGFAALGTPGLVTLTDLQEMSVLGYTLAGPAISGTVGGQTVSTGKTISPFAAAKVTETDPSVSSLALAVVLSNPSNGSLSNLGGGAYNAATGTYTISGSASAVQTALEDLVFTASTVGTTTFSIGLSDGVAAPATDSTTTVAARAPEVQDAFLGGAVSGLLWQNASSGATYEWSFTSGQPTGSISLGGASGYSAIATGDFTGSGTSDVIWRNTSPGATYEWLMTNGQHTGDVYLGNLSGWTPTVGYFNDNSVEGVVWNKHSTGETYEWSFVNGQHTGTDVNLGTVSGWSLVGAGNFTGNGTSDLIWKNDTSGATSEWLMTSGQHTGDVSLGSTQGWNAIGVGGFTGNGTDDMLWQSASTGDVYEWIMSNGQHTGDVYLGNMQGWSVAGTGDYFGTGTSGLIWQNNTTGSAYEWTFSAGQHVAGSDIYLGVLSGWTPK